MKNRCICERGRLISDLLEMREILNKEGFLVTVDIKKAFDYVNHLFLINILEKIEKFDQSLLYEKCPDTEFFLVRTFPNSD